jgi:hypothetical protein
VLRVIRGWYLVMIAAQNRPNNKRQVGIWLGLQIPLISILSTISYGINGDIDMINGGFDKNTAFLNE